MDQSKLEANVCSGGKAREKLVAIGFPSDWMTKWREFFFKPLAWRSYGKPTQLTFDIPVKTAKNREVIRLQVQYTLQLQKALLSSGRSHRVVLLGKTLTFQRAYLYPGELE